MIDSRVLEKLIRVQMDAGCSSDGRFKHSVSDSTCASLARSLEKFGPSFE